MSALLIGPALSRQKEGEGSSGSTSLKEIYSLEWLSSFVPLVPDTS